MSLEYAIFRFSKGKSWPAWYFTGIALSLPSLTPLLEFESSTLHIEIQAMASHFIDDDEAAAAWVAETDVATNSFLALDEEESFCLKSS